MGKSPSDGSRVIITAYRSYFKTNSGGLATDSGLLEVDAGY
jgi:hypothetical protein